MFSLLIFLLLQSFVLAAPLDKRAYAFVTRTLAPVYVTVNGQGANEFHTITPGATYYSTQWPAAETPAPAPPAPPAPPAATAPDNDDYNTVLVSTQQAPPPDSTPEIVNSVQGKNPVPEASQPAETQPAQPETQPAETQPETQPAQPENTQSAAPTDPQPDTPSAVQSTQAATSAPAETTTAQAETSTEPETTSQAPTSSEQTVDPTTTPSTTILPVSTVITTSSAAETTTSVTTTSVPAETSVAANSGGITPPDYIVYSPYLDTQGCKDYGTVLNDLKLIQSKGINKLRTYGTDCGNMDTILPAAQSLGMVVSQGIWIGPSGLGSAVDQSVSDIIAYGQTHGWGVIESVVFGNEDIVNNYVSAPDLINAARNYKAQLRAAGFGGLFMHAEVTNIIHDNPDLCGDVFDVVALNAHSYFDPYSTAPESGDFVKGQIGIVQSVCGAKKVWISETGYPSRGITNGGQVPSHDNQIAAVQSIIDVVGRDVVILTTFNDMWKSPGPYGVEQYFGVIDLLA